MNKRYQVFVSSTFEDLKDERSKVIQALLNFDCIPCGMEYFPAADEDAWKCIERLIPECDYYIVILGGMYGSIPPKRKKSYTHLEYELAVKHGVPVIGLLHRNPEELPLARSESLPSRRKKLARFRAQVERKLCRYWQTPDQLPGELLPSLREQQNRFPRTGWVRADTIADDEAKSQIIALQRKLDKQARQLDDYYEQEKRDEENLASGSDEFALSANFPVWHSVGKKEVRSRVRIQAKTTWDALVRFIRDNLGVQWSRHQLNERICKSLESRIPKKLCGTEKGSIQIDDWCLDAIEVQLVALGLCVQKGSGWNFTTKGLKYASQLSAIKKGQHSRLLAETFHVTGEIGDPEPIFDIGAWQL